MDERELLKTIGELEERIEILEIKVYGEKPSDLIACTFDITEVRRWDNKKDKMEDSGFFESCEKQEYVTCPEDTGSEFNICGPPELIERYKEEKKLRDNGWDICMRDIVHLEFPNVLPHPDSERKWPHNIFA